MMCGVADEGSAALFVCGGEGRIWLWRRGTCRTDGRGGIGGRMMPMRPSARQVRPHSDSLLRPCRVRNYWYFLSTVPF